MSVLHAGRRRAALTTLAAALFLQPLAPSLAQAQIPPALLHEDDPRHGVLASWLAQQGDVVVVQKMGAAVLVDLPFGTYESSPQAAFG